MQTLTNHMIQSHCGPNGFSPAAPPELCNYSVPEAGTLPLILLAGVISLLFRKRK